MFRPKTISAENFFGRTIFERKSFTPKKRSVENVFSRKLFRLKKFTIENFFGRKNEGARRAGKARVTEIPEGGKPPQTPPRHHFKKFALQGQIF